MKRFTTALGLLAFLISATAQTELKDVKIQTLGEIPVSISDIIRDNKDPVLFFTWAADWCVPCVSVLDEIETYFYDDYREEYNLKLIGINVATDKTPDDIKEFILKKGWTFDIYMDPEKNLLNYFNKNSAPDAFIFKDKEMIFRKAGFVSDDDGGFDIELTAEAILLAIDAIDARMMVYDDKWNLTATGDIEYFRTVDKEDGLYFVQDRWAEGELKMKGQYSDKYLKNEVGKFTWYYKSGPKEHETYYENGKLAKIIYWYENGQIWSTRIYQDGRMYNINGLYSPNGSTMYHGTLSNGNGSLISYRDDGTKSSERNYKDGYLHGTYTYYSEDGTTVTNQYEYENGQYKGKK